MKFFPLAFTLTCSALLLNNTVFAQNKSMSKIQSKSQNTHVVNQTAKSQAEQSKTTSQKKLKKRQIDTSVSKSQANNTESQSQSTSTQPRKSDKKYRSRSAANKTKQTHINNHTITDTAKSRKKTSVTDDEFTNNIAGEKENTAIESPKKATKRPHKSGVASWYGGGFHGRLTANGERYNMNDLTAAHRTLPFGTQVRVTNLRNNKSVNVRINDRGPYSHGRVIDLSRKANQMIDCHLCQVSLEVLGN